jgi:2-methylcitrate dehydratase PrpD
MIGHSAGVLAAAAVPLQAQSTPVPREQAAPAADLTGRVARYMAAARQQALSADVVREAKHRILDTIAAMISGARLKPGEMAIRFAARAGRNGRSVDCHDEHPHIVINAALVNAMFAHADETDDFEPVTKAHPGCSAVPAALASASGKTHRVRN